MNDFRQDFIRFAIDSGVLRFGTFVTKSGRQTPYFFNAGLFNPGAKLDRLAQFYAMAIETSGVKFEMLFGPAYKGILLAGAASMALARRGIDVPYCFNRKEAKDHGEGGNLVGAPLRGKVLIVDDVITAGTAVRESVDIISAAGATPCGVVISIDRMERGSGELSAVQEVKREFGIPVIAIASLEDLLRYLEADPAFRENFDAVATYRAKYGAQNHV